jgi:spoIIIJ-associated protein
MKNIEIKGNNLNEIISSFRKEHKIKDWELQYEVVSKPFKGLFGIFGNKQAVVRFSLPSSEERVKLFLEQLLAYMEIKYDNIKIKTEQKTVYATINNSSDAGFLIGKNGNMLEQLQYLINRVFENVPNLERVYLDTEDYRYRQEQTFIRAYIPIINKVKTTGKSVTLEAMQSGERRIIHKYVEGEKTLKTLTIGEGDSKRIVIMPSGQKEPEPVKRHAPLRKNETPKRVEPAKQDNLTPEQRAALSYKKHNRSYPDSKTSQHPRKTEK